MGAIPSQITSPTIVYSTVDSDADQRKHESSASLAFVRGIHRGPVNSPHKWPVARKMFPFDDVIMSYSVFSQISMAGCFVKQLETAATDILIVSFAKAGSLEYVMKNEMIVKNTLSWIYPLHVSFKIESPFCNRNYGYIWVKIKSSKLPEGTDTVLADRL